MPKQVDIPYITGKTHYDVEQAIYRLREAIEAHGAQLEAQDEAIAGMAPLTLSEIQQALSPTGDYPLPTAGLLNTVPANTGGGDVQPPITVPNHLDIAQAAHDSLGISPTSTVEEIFRYAQLTAWNISMLGTDPPSIHVGLLAQPTGDAIFTCAGTSYAAYRICYDNGANIKLLTSPEHGAQAEWFQEANVDIPAWRPPTDPSGPC